MAESKRGFDASLVLGDALKDWKPITSKQLLPQVTGVTAALAGSERLLLNASGFTAAKQINAALAGRHQSQMFAKVFAAQAAYRLTRFAPPKVDLGVTSTRLAQVFAGVNGTKLSSMWQPALGAFAESAKQLIADQEVIDAEAAVFVDRHGWPIPVHLPISIFRQIVALAPESKRRVNAEMLEAFRPGTRPYRESIDALLTSAHFESRRPLLRQALAAHRRGEWYLVINGLLPLVEGVLVDAVFASTAPPRRGAAEKAIRKIRDEEWRSLGIVVEAVETILLSAGANVALFDSFDRQDYGRPGEPRALNRHAILHGAARRYGSELNATKLLLLLVVIAECLEHYDRRLAAAGGS